MRPSAIGTDVVPILRLSKSVLMPGATAPSEIPAAIARKIQSVRNLSRKDSRRRTGTESTVTLAHDSIPTYRSVSGDRLFARNSMFPDLPDSLLQRGAVQRFQAQARKDFDSIF